MQKFTKLLFLLLFAFVFVHGQDSSASKKKKNGIAAIPMINYNRTQGIMVGAIVSKYYKINKKDTISPSSNTGITGIYTAAEKLCTISLFTIIFCRRPLAHTGSSRHHGYKLSVLPRRSCCIDRQFL